MLWTGQPPPGNLFILMTQWFVEEPERVNTAVSGTFIFLVCQNIAYFIFQLKPFISPLRLKKSLKIYWWWNPNVLFCPFLHSPLTLLLTMHDCPLPGTAAFERVLRSLGLQQEGNEWALFSQNFFATSCVECRGSFVHFKISLVTGPLLGNGKLSVFLATNLSLHRVVRIIGCIFLTKHRKYPGGFPTALLMLIWLDHILYPLHTSPHSVFPDNAKVGTFCSKFISQQCYQIASRKFFSDVGSPWLYRESENHAGFTLRSTWHCISSPVSSH